MPKLTPVVLSGGSGTRLWPLSREKYSKQQMIEVQSGGYLGEGGIVRFEGTYGRG